MIFPSKLDRIVLRALMMGKVEFDERLPGRFAKIGDARFYRPVVGSCRWGLLFGHDSRDYGIDLGYFAHLCMCIASKHVSKETTKD